MSPSPPHVHHQLAGAARIQILPPHLPVGGLPLLVPMHSLYTDQPAQRPFRGGAACTEVLMALLT